MERKRVVGVVAALAMMSGIAAAQEAGPYNLPALEKVKKEIKLTDDEATKVTELYAQAAKNEAESKARAKENGTDRKTLEGNLANGKGEIINKIKEVLDRDKGSAFDKMVASQPPPEKKKKK
jgi:hypothetical protein